MKLNNSTAEMYVPDGQALPGALQRTTHLGIGAHQDDLEFSGSGSDRNLDRWALGLTNIRREPLPGLYGVLHSRLWVELQIRRQFPMAMAPPTSQAHDQTVPCFSLTRPASSSV